MASETLPFLLTGAFLTSLVLSLAGTYVVRGWALSRGFVDHPNDARRIHRDPTPNVGGIAIAAATMLSFLFWSFWLVPDAVRRPDIVAMMTGGAAIFGVGFLDDTRPLKAWTKFSLQVLIAGLVFWGGVRIMGVGFGGLWFSQLTAFAGLIVTVIWIVGTTNAFNLIDGSDGVAGGAAMFASIAMGIIFALNGDPLGALMATILVGACLGFLFFNFPPATVFMGDCGALFLGFTLATLGVITTQKSTTLLAVTIPVIAFGVPLLDTTIAIVRRYLRHEHIFAPDRGHIHHRLGDLGLSSRRVAVFIYVACAGCASLSLLLAAPGRPTVLPVFVVASAVLILGVQRLNVPELIELSRVVGRGFQQRSVISHNVRLHQVSEAVRSAGTMDEMVGALADAFEGSEFSALELWASERHGAAFADHDLASPLQAGHRLRIEYERVLHPDQEYEVRLPVYLVDEEIGVMSLFRNTGGPRLYTDLRLVARMLVPVVARTLERLAEDHGGSESQARF